MTRTRDAIVSRCCDFGLSKDKAEELTTRYLQWFKEYEEIGGCYYTLDYFIQFSIEWEKATSNVKRRLKK